MSTAQATLPGGARSGAAGETPSLPGRVEVREGVFQKITEKVAATVIGVDASNITVTVADYRDGIAVRLRAPFPAPSLEDTAAVTAAGPIIQAAEHAQQSIITKLSALLGRPITRVDITITGAVAPTRRRVR